MLPPQTIFKTLQNYISVQVVSLKLLISSRILKSSLEKFTASRTCFKHLDSNNNMSDDLFKPKLAHPNEFFTPENICVPITSGKSVFGQHQNKNNHQNKT